MTIQVIGDTMKIDDENIIKALEYLGPSRAYDLNEYFRNNQKNDRSKLNHKLKMLHIYKFIDKLDTNKGAYYFIPGDKRQLEINPYTVSFMSFLIRDFIEGIPEGGTITAKDIADKFNCSISWARKQLNDNPRLSKEYAPYPIFVYTKKSCMI